MSTFMKIFIVAAIIVGVVIALKVLSVIGAILFKLAVVVVIIGLIVLVAGKLSGKIK